MQEIKSIAITGKGGTGKTMIATVMIKLLAMQYKVLAIDADSAMSLPYTFGLSVKKTVSQLRKEVIGPAQLRKSLHSWLSDMLTHGDGFELLTMGRPEEPGCFCAVNDLLRYGIDLLVGDYDITIIDGEAGPEQLNRQVLKSIDVLLVVSDMSARSLETARAIIDVARAQDGDIKVKKSGLILNRIRGDEPDQQRLAKTGLEVLGRIPEDKTLNEYDRAGRTLLELPNDSDCVVAVRHMLEALLPDFRTNGVVY